MTGAVSSQLPTSTEPAAPADPLEAILEQIASFDEGLGELKASLKHDVKDSRLQAAATRLVQMITKLGGLHTESFYDTASEEFRIDDSVYLGYVESAQKDANSLDGQALPA
ncbi:MAG: hypothetical protein OXU45_02935, partial [Candidatus Melainabacteria bacterium]|nr:hypothetical protein [Candidatus Melainabacteria bacterium]